MHMREAIGPHGFFKRRGKVGVLLVHGLTGTPAEMKPFAMTLARYGLTVACPQLAGHCTEVSDLKKTDWEDWYQSVEVAFEAMTKECDRVFVSGLSVGALLALLIAARHGDRVSGVIPLSAVFVFDGWNIPLIKRYLMRLLAYSPLRHIMYWEESSPYGIKCEHTRARVAAVLESKDARSADKVGYFKMPVTIIQESMRLMKVVRNILPKVDSPTLVVHSTEDDTASVRNAHLIAKKVAARHVETYFIDDCYHVITLDKRRNDIARRVADFCLRQAELRSAAVAVPSVSVGLSG